MTDRHITLSSAPTDDAVGPSFIPRRATCRRRKPGRMLRLALAAAALWAAIASPRTADAAPRWIKEFVGLKSRWSDLVGTSWTLDGRYSVFGEREMRMVNCSMPFVLAERFPRPRGNSSNVRVFGTIEREQKRLIFRVTRIEYLPSDAEQLRVRRSAIDTGQAEEWYKLAEWVSERAEFYNDNDLRKEVRDLQTNGIETERRALAAEDAQGLFALAEKAESLGLAEDLQLDLLHQAYRRDFTNRSRQKPPQLVELLAGIKRDLPGSEIPLGKQQAAELLAYRKQPVEAYRTAEDVTRKLYHRQFYVDVQQLRLQSELAADGSNGYALAIKSEELLPERPELAEEFRQREIAGQRERVPLMTRQELRRFIARLEDRNDTKQILAAKKEWFAAQEERLRRDGARGIAELGDLWLELFDDVEGAARLYMEAYAADPDYHRPSDWLSEHGYAYRQGKWIPKALIPKDPEQMRLEQAIKEGRVMLGMTDEQARAAMGGPPTSVSRFASSGQVTELWVYDAAGIAIRLERRNRREQSRVVGLRTVSVLRTP